MNGNPEPIDEQHVEYRFEKNSSSGGKYWTVSADTTGVTIKYGAISSRRPRTTFVSASVCAANGNTPLAEAAERAESKKNGGYEFCYSTNIEGSSSQPPQSSNSAHKPTKTSTPSDPYAEIDGPVWF